MQDYGNGEVYALIAKSDGYYKNVRTGGKEFLRQGEIWKIGQTLHPDTRYTRNYLYDNNVSKKTIYKGNLMQILMVEKLYLYTII